MSAPEVCAKLVEAVNDERFDVVIINFANPDMVGHTGVLSAAIAAVETVDRAVGEIVAAVRAKGGELLVTADHGNCEMMRDPVTGEPQTSHTVGPVDLVYVGSRAATLRRGGAARPGADHPRPDRHRQAGR